MSATLLNDLPIKHLEYVFSPPGLTLPTKGDHNTTSVLVRGGAGTGKTTFALALAQPIAKAGGGLVLYLTTEFSPVEIKYKAKLVGLSEDSVDFWPGTEHLGAGGVVVQHLSALRDDQAGVSSAEQKRSVIDAVWELLHPTSDHVARPRLPVRAVVIDALTLPEVGEGDSALRTDLVRFVQALENEGTSVLLVEELAHGAADWSAFIVDVVFELAFHPDPETLELRRKLTVSKCRYALSIPGPHDYGLDGGVPSVWPDLFRVMTGGHGGPLAPAPTVNVPTIKLPMDAEGTWALLGSSIVLSPYDKTGPRAVNAFSHTPGVGRLRIDCGPTTDVGTHSQVFDNEGPFAIGWAILEVAKQLPSMNFCQFQGLDGLCGRPGWATPVVHLLKALSLAGFLVCVHGPAATMAPLTAAADMVWGGVARAGRLPPRRHRAFARWCVPAPWLRESASHEEHFVGLATAMEPEALRAAHDAITGLSPQPTSLDSLRLWILQELCGGKVNTQLVNAGSKEGQQAAWLAFHCGADWHAARAALKAVELDTPDASMVLLWKAVCAAIAGNAAAVEELKPRIHSPDEALVFDAVLRGLACTSQFAEADRLIAECGERHSLAPWMLDRLRADVRLDATDPAARRGAAVLLATLAKDETLPLVHRAETSHNLGAALDLLGERGPAIAAYERALELNPFLDASREELARLKGP